jgi:hypothetical protein
MSVHAEMTIKGLSQMKLGKIFGYAVTAAVLVVLLFVARGIYYGAKTMHELLAENKQLKEAITRLTAEEQIGYAKVLSQETKDGRNFTTIKFVETARDDKNKKILEKECTVEGDIVHFDALIVKFSDKMVMDGRERSMYLWRRVYGEKMTPETGFPIEQSGTEPLRYNDLLKKLRLKDRELFWQNIWELANNPDMLKADGITAIYGNAVYTKLQKGSVYIFKINAMGQVYPEVVPDF